jgi:hypothetical protein
MRVTKEYREFIRSLPPGQSPICLPKNAKTKEWRERLAHVEKDKIRFVKKITSKKQPYCRVEMRLAKKPCPCCGWKWFVATVRTEEQKRIKPDSDPNGFRFGSVKCFWCGMGWPNNITNRKTRKRVPF